MTVPRYRLSGPAYLRQPGRLASDCYAAGDEVEFTGPPAMGMSPLNEQARLNYARSLRMNSWRAPARVTEIAFALGLAVTAAAIETWLAQHPQEKNP